MNSTDGGFVLPENVDPPTFCMTLEVPDDPQYIASLAGALWELQYWWNWQRDNAHTAVPVTRLWRRLIQEAFDRINAGHLCVDPNALSGVEVEDNEMNLRIKPTDPCIIQIRCGEDQWEDWYDPRNCIAAGATEATSQQGPGGQLGTGECKSYDLTVSGKAQYLVPVPVQGGMTLTFSNLGGMWFDGSLWYCPTGSSNVLGYCVGSPGHVGGDPSATAYHMQAILKVGATYYPIISGGTITIPAGQPLQDAYIQCNDASFTDNNGAISLSVSICQATANQWSHTFNPTTLGAWTQYTSDPDYNGAGVFTYGSGWAAQTKVGIAGGVWRTYVFLKPPISTFNYTTMTVKCNYVRGQVNGDADAIFETRENTQTNVPDGTPNTRTYTGTFTWPSNGFLYYACARHDGSAPSPAGSMLVTEITFSGFGVDPFL